MFHKPLSPIARRLVCFGLTAPSVLVTVACVFTFQDLGRMETAFGWVRHALQVENRIHQLVLNVHQFDDNQRAYLFTGRRSYRESFSAAEARVPVDLAALGQDIESDPVQRRRFLELEQVVLQRSGVARQAVELKKAGQHDGAHKLARSELGQDGMDRIHTLAEAMRQHEDLLLVSRDRALAARRQGHAHWLFGLLLLNLSSLACTLLLLHHLDKAQSLARVCAWSKRIELDGQWLSLEEYLSRRFNIGTTHTISPSEADRVMATLASESWEAERRVER